MSDKRPFLSVALCTYNGSIHLAEQLSSIAAQTRLPDELVVCDDGSTDGSVGVIQSWASSMSFPVHVHVNRSNLGVIKNFERAISLCRGDIVALSDQDDVWHVDKLSWEEALLQARPGLGLVFTDADVVDECLRPLGYSMWDSCRFSRAEQSMVRRGKAVDVLLRRNVVTGATMAFRSHYKSLILPMPPNPVHLHDYWIAFLIASVAEIDFLPDRLVKYRQQPSQQIGAHQPVSPRWLLAEARRNSRATNLERYRATLEWFNEVRRRLCERRSQFSLDVRIVDEINGKLALCRDRIQMPSSRARRLPLLARDVAAFRYHRYSTGMWAAVRDLTA